MASARAFASLFAVPLSPSAALSVESVVAVSVEGAVEIVASQGLGEQL